MAPLVVAPQPAQAGAQNFSCTSIGGVPTTTAEMAGGRQVPVIRWTSSAFDGAGWTPERRCQEVSSRFATYNREGRLKYITTGRINGQPVICTTPRNGGSCDGLLYTLKPGQNATATLRNLFDVRFKARGPLNETTARLYVKVDDLLAGKASGEVPDSIPAAAGSKAEPLF